MHKTVLACVGSSVAAALVLAGCSTSSSESVDGSNPQGETFKLVAQPEDGGAVISGAIEAAKQSVDIPIYSIGGPEITASLSKAKANGVHIRIMTNGGYGANVPAAQNLQQTLNAAPGSGTVTIQWSSNNFNITHQKSVIVDAADKSGKPLGADALPDSAFAVISTGNFSDYNGPFWSARDFALVTKDPQIVAQMEAVFANDYSCPTYDVINPQGLQPTDRLVWSNGSTGLPTAGQYPEKYPLTDRSTGQWTQQGYVVQGNGRGAYLAPIQAAGAGDIVRFTNEELTDPEIVAALTKAATPVAQGGQGADVRIIMTLPKGYTPATAQKFSGTMSGIWSIVKAGGTAHMFTNNSTVPAALYIHAKMVALNSSQAFLGSENAGFMSLNANRELGANLTADDSEAIGALVNTFDTDWARGADWVTIWTPQNVPTPPAGAVPVPSGSDLQATGGLGDSEEQKCGPVLPTSKK